MRKSARGGAGSRTFPRGSDSAPRAPTSTSIAEAKQQRALDRARVRSHELVDGVERYGDGSLPHILCLSVAGVEAEPILLALDQHGVAVHSGSSCSSESLEPSPVLAAMGVDAEHSLRISVGWSSTDADVDRFVEVFPGIVERLRGLRGP